MTLGKAAGRAVSYSIRMRTGRGVAAARASVMYPICSCHDPRVKSRSAKVVTLNTVPEPRAARTTDAIVSCPEEDWQDALASVDTPCTANNAPEDPLWNESVTSRLELARITPSLSALGADTKSGAA